MHDLTKEARKSDVNRRLTSEGVVPYAMTEALLREEDISLYNVISNIVSREWRPLRGVGGGWCSTCNCAQEWTWKNRGSRLNGKVKGTRMCSPYRSKYLSGVKLWHSDLHTQISNVMSQPAARGLTPVFPVLQCDSLYVPFHIHFLSTIPGVINCPHHHVAPCAVFSQYPWSVLTTDLVFFEPQQS